MLNELRKIENYNAMTEFEQQELQTLFQEERITHKLLDEWRYEIINNCTTIDWLNMYSQVIPRYDMNEIITNAKWNEQYLKAKRDQDLWDSMIGLDPKFEFEDPENLFKSDEEWDQSAEYCKWLHDFYRVTDEALSSDIYIDLEQFMRNESYKSRPADQKSIF
jgi:hypothetical protein